MLDELAGSRRRRRWIVSSISITAWLAPPCSGPHRAQMPAEIEANRFAWLAADHAHRRGRAVLLVVGVQDEEQVERLVERRRDLVRLGRHREHHVQEVRGVGEVVARVDERLADRLLVREGGDRLRLGEQADDVQVDVVVRRPGSRSRARPPSPTGSPSGGRSAGSPRRTSSCPRGAGVWRVSSRAELLELLLRSAARRRSAGRRPR